MYGPVGGRSTCEKRWLVFCRSAAAGWRDELQGREHGRAIAWFRIQITALEQDGSF